jgi:hypothetical protein
MRPKAILVPRTQKGAQVFGLKQLLAITFAAAPSGENELRFGSLPQRVFGAFAEKNLRLGERIAQTTLIWAAG